jgi:acyl-coenzyme A thioesterase PaaI-like protein
MNGLPDFIRRRLSPARRLEWYPPLRALRVRVLELSPDWRRVRIRLPLRENRNPGGGMFGGAMACVADPVAALSCVRLFPGHAVWTRELALDFRHEARTDMELRYAIDPAHEQAIRDELAQRGRATPAFAYGFFDRSGRECVKVRCRVAIRPAGYRPCEGLKVGRETATIDTINRGTR